MSKKANKNRNLLIILAVVAGILFLVSRRKKSGTSNSRDNLAEAPEVQETTDETVYDPNVGEGKTLVDNRVKSLYNSSTGEDMKQSQSADPYRGLKYPEGMREVISSIYGSPSSFPAVPIVVDRGFVTFLEDVSKGPNFEQITGSAGIDQAFSTWKRLAVYKDYSFWPRDLEGIINANLFGNTTKADKNKSERYNAFTEDLKIFASNLISFTKSYEQNLKNEAIIDLQEAGYKFLI